MHPFFKMDIFQVNRLLKLFGIIRRYQGPVLIEQVAFAIALEDRAEDPSVAMEVAKLRVLEFAVEFGRADLLQEVEIRPQAARCRAFRIACCYPAALFRGRIALSGGI